MFHFSLNTRHFRIFLVDRSDGIYESASALARKVYWDSYGAIIAPHPHCFIVCEDAMGGQMLACAGISFGGEGALFSEQYLDVPLDFALTRIYERNVGRDDVAEISALATLEPLIGTELVRSIPLICWYLGVRGLLCTVTEKLQRGFTYLKLPFHPIATPDPARLRAVDGVHWGSYYDSNPVTGVIRLDCIGHMFETYCGRYRHFSAGTPARIPAMLRAIPAQPVRAAA